MARKTQMNIVVNRRGQQVRLLNPSEKGGKFATELKYGTHFTNLGEVKKKKNGKPKRLSDTQKAYRSGYLQARKDNANAWKSNEEKRRILNYNPYK